MTSPFDLLRYPWPNGPIRTHYLVAVDPGVHVCGVAVGLVTSRGAALTRAHAVRARSGGGDPIADMADAVDAFVLRHTTDIGPIRFVFEDPQTYPGEPGRADDLERLRTVLRAIDTYGVVPHYVHPNDWKGNVPKDVHHARIRERIAHVVEWQHVEDDHNARDAAALWMWAVGRADRGGTRPRRRAVSQQSPDEILAPVIAVDRDRARAFVARLFEAAPPSDPNSPLWDIYHDARDLFGPDLG